MPQTSQVDLPYRGEDPARVRISCTTLADLLLTAADRWPDAEAVVFPEHRATYTELVEAVTARARSLKGLGVGHGDHVGLLLPTGKDFVEMFFAVAMCGAIAVLMNARYKPSELAYVAENADLKLIVTIGRVAESVDFVERLGEAFDDLSAQADPLRLSLARAPKLQAIVSLGESGRPGLLGEDAFVRAVEAVEALDVHRARLNVCVRDIAMMLYTSGTSANPKGCLITHEAMARNSINLGRQRWRFTHADKVWSPLPLFHIAAVMPLLSILDAGGTYIGMPVFDPGLSLKMIEGEQATAIFAPFVTFLQAMMYHPDFARTDLSRIKVMNSCFAVMPKSVGDAYREAMPNALQVGTYGMTEASGIVSTGSYEMDPEMGYTRLGVPLLGIDVRIVDRETGQDLPRGAEGEVLLRGYNLFDGYYKDPAKTQETLDADGWCHTGDIGSLDGADHLMFHGRTKDMLKVGGENVAAAEVEATLARHPAVKLAQVFGVPDPRLEEAPVACVELEPGAEASEADLIAFCRREIAGFKVPRAIRFVEEWPMSASKIQKFRLREAYLSPGAREAGA